MKYFVYSKLRIISFLLLFFQTQLFANNWSLYLERPDKKPLLIKSFSFDETNQLSFDKYVDGFHITFKADKKGDYWAYVAEASSVSGDKKCYLSLVRSYSKTSKPYNFDGLVQKSGVYRQSPHEPADHHFIQHLLMQPVPMIAVQNATEFEIAISNTPAVFENYTTQTYNLKNRQLRLSSGDNGYVYKNNSYQLNTDTVDRKAKKLFRIESFYFVVKPEKSHKFDGIYFKINKEDANKLRETVNLYISKHWSNKEFTDKLGSTFFSTAYMNLRVNETGKSNYWVVPSIDYSNKQYSRDAFWISMMLPPRYSQSCFENEAAANETFIGAERQLFTIVWAYRNYLNGIPVDTLKMSKILKIIESRVKNGHYSGYTKDVPVEGCWQGQADLIAYEKDDAISNNQGLLVVALKCAQKMGLKPTVSIEQARQNYENMYNPQIKGFSLSLYKDTILAVDALMGDLLSQVYLNEALIPSEKAINHYRTMNRVGKTKYGYKFFCNAGGSFLKQNQYDSPSFKSAITEVIDGYYQCGGSWYLYDMIMLMNAYLHGAENAEDMMIWRTKLEFQQGNSTHEFLNTLTGVPHKPNMGWNAGVYGIWFELIKQRKATDRFFNEINQLK